MASSSDKSQMLFACTHCHHRCKFEELSGSQQLCKNCRKQFPSVTCTYCRLEFHPVKSSTDHGSSRPACEHCAREFRQHGTPSFCSICNLQSAFTGKKCSQCSRSEKKYGSPVSCDDCQLVCAFAKPEDVKQKVGGKSLCLLCTINYKKAQFKRKSLAEQKGTSSFSSSHSSTSGSKHLRDKHSVKHPKYKPKEKDGEPSLKKLKLGSSQVAVTSSSHHLSLLGSHSPSMDTVLSSNHMLETEKLQNEISSLKKQLAQKEQTILEKDKQICQLRAEVGEKDRDLRTKLQDKQKSHLEAIESFQTDIRGLKKQLSQSTQKKSSSSAAAGSSQSSMIASLTSSLAATPVNSTSS